MLDLSSNGLTKFILLTIVLCLSLIAQAETKSQSEAKPNLGLKGESTLPTKSEKDPGRAQKRPADSLEKGEFGGNTAKGNKNDTYKYGIQDPCLKQPKLPQCAITGGGK